MQPQSEMVILGTFTCPVTDVSRWLTNSEDMALGYFASLEYGTDGRVSLLPFGKECSQIARMAVQKRKNRPQATTESIAFDTAENVAILESEMPNMIPGNEVRGKPRYSASYLARRARPSLSLCF